MQGGDADMDGQPIDHAIRDALDLVHEHVESQPAYAGHWIDLPTRVIHLALAAPTAENLVDDLRSQVPAEIRLQVHRVTHPWAALQALHQTTSDYMECRGFRTLYSVDSSAQVKTNEVLLRLKDTTPNSVVEDIIGAFPNSPVRIERTGSRWTAY